MVIRAIWRSFQEIGNGELAVSEVIRFCRDSDGRLVDGHTDKPIPPEYFDIVNMPVYNRVYP